MNRDHDNKVLKAVMQKVYADRNRLPETPLAVVRTEKANQRILCEIWFMTEGCRHDMNGGCTMCNYGKGHVVSPEAVLSEIRNRLAGLPACLIDLVINPSGSFLDGKEVSPELRASIYALLKKTDLASLTVECRSDVIEPGVLAELRDTFRDKELFVEIGVETSNPWLLRNSINKGCTVDSVKSSLTMLHESGISAIANIGLGFPFLSEQHNITQARLSIAEMLRLGFDEVILFPYHIKPGTLLEVLHDMGLYDCVSLWSLSEVLNSLSDEESRKVNISWYRNYYTDQSKVISSPQTCPQCSETVLGFLDEYRNGAGKTAVDKLNAVRCDCRRLWERRMASEEDRIHYEKITRAYEKLAKKFGIANTLLSDELTAMKEELICLAYH